MSKYRWLLLQAVLATIAVAASAQVVSSPHSNFGGHDYSYFSVRITPEDAARFSVVENTNRLKHEDFVASQQTGAPFFLINASISDGACQPLGYYVMNGTELKPVNTQSGDGNFYLKPNGAFLVTSNEVTVVESGAIAAQSGVNFGIQSGPLLVENNTINAAFGAASKNRHVRCGVGVSTVSGDRYVNFVISNEAVSFFEIAAFFQEKLKCSTALCLESAGCDMYFPERDVSYNAGSTTVCRYIKYTLE